MASKFFPLAGVEHIDELQSLNFRSSAAAYFETLLMVSVAAAFWHFLQGV